MRGAKSVKVEAGLVIWVGELVVGKQKRPVGSVLRIEICVQVRVFLKVFVLQGKVLRPVEALLRADGQLVVVSTELIERPYCRRSEASVKARVSLLETGIGVASCLLSQVVTCVP